MCAVRTHRRTLPAGRFSIHGSRTRTARIHSPPVSAPSGIDRPRLATRVRSAPGCRGNGVGRATVSLGNGDHRHRAGPRRGWPRGRRSVDRRPVREQPASVVGDLCCRLRRVVTRAVGSQHCRRERLRTSRRAPGGGDGGSGVLPRRQHLTVPGLRERAGEHSSQRRRTRSTRRGLVRRGHRRSGRPRRGLFLQRWRFLGSSVDRNRCARSGRRRSRFLLLQAKESTYRSRGRRGGQDRPERSGGTGKLPQRRTRHPRQGNTRRDRQRGACQRRGAHARARRIRRFRGCTVHHGVRQRQEGAGIGLRDSAASRRRDPGDS